jgi:hypothetical protein
MTTGIPGPPALARRGDPETSHQAAAEVSTKISERRLSVLRQFARFKELAGYEIEMLFQNSGSGYRSRIKELQDMGFVRRVLDEDGKPKTKLEKGTKRMLREITPAGRALLKLLDS